MKLKDAKNVFIVIGLIGVLLIASPAIAGFVNLPKNGQFSALSLLGPNQMAENYPSNIVTGPNYSVYVGVENQMASSQSYILYLKLMNQTDPLPDDATGAPSPIQPLYEYRFSIVNNQSWSSLLTFSISSAIVANNQSTIQNFKINGLSFNVQKSAIWNSTTSEFPYTLLFELWSYNPQSGLVEYNDRFVDLQLHFDQATG